MIYRARAPLRISFAGGSTDIAPYCYDYGGRVLNATINRYATVTLIPKKGKKTIVRSRQFGTQVAYDRPLPEAGRYKLVNTVINEYNIPHSFELIIEHDAPAGSGLGGSSALVVALVALFDRMAGRKRDRTDLAQYAYDLERVKVGMAGGHQDQWAATFGGMNEIVFERVGSKVFPLTLDRDIQAELEHNLLLCYSGVQRTDTRIIEDQIEAVKHGRNLMALERLKQVVGEMIDALIARDVDCIGHLLHVAWMNKRMTSDKISNPRIDHLYDIALNAGATGGKISGAGGGGYMFFYCPDTTREDVKDALIGERCVPVPFSFVNQGVMSWTR